MRKKFLLLAMVVITMFLSLSGCVFLKDDEMEELLIDSLNAVQTEDYEKLSFMLSEETRNQLNGSTAGFEDVHNFFQGTVSNVIMIKRSIQSNSYNGGPRILTKDFRYIVITSEGVYEAFLATTSSEEDSGITQFRIRHFTDSLLVGFAFQFNSVGSWVMLIFSLLVLAFRIISTVSAAKSNIKMKPLWIVLIWIAQSGFSITCLPNNFNFRIQLINAMFSGFQSFAGNGFLLTVLIPVGAILYWILRKRLIKPEPPKPGVHGQNDPPFNNEFGQFPQ